MLGSVKGFKENESSQRLERHGGGGGSVSHRLMEEDLSERDLREVAIRTGMQERVSRDSAGLSGGRVVGEAKEQQEAGAE